MISSSMAVRESCLQLFFKLMATDYEEAVKSTVHFNPMLTLIAVSGNFDHLLL